MSIIRTEHSVVAWRKELTWGNSPAGGNFKRFGNFEAVNAPDPEYAWYPFFGVFAGRNRKQIFRGKQTLRGSISDIKMQGKQTTFLEVMLGRYASNWYTEGKSATDETIPSFELFIIMKDTDGVEQLMRFYKGGLVNRWTISANEGEELRYSIDEMLFKDMLHNVAGVAKYAGYLTCGVDAESAEGRFMFSECKFEMFGLTFSHIRRFSLTCDQQIEMRYYLQRGGGADSQQVPNGYVPGRRAYRLEVDLDMSDPAIDRDIYEFLLNQGAAAWPGYTVGTSITMQFDQTGCGEGSDKLTLFCSTYPAAGNQGSVLLTAPVNIPAPPAGVPTVTATFDVNMVTIYSLT